MTAFLDGLKWDKNSLVAVIVQHIDTGEVLMQAFADRAAISETMQTGTCWFREASLSAPHAAADAAPSTDAGASAPCVAHEGHHEAPEHVPRTTLLALERTIAQRREALAKPSDGSKPSWTARLLGNPELLCKKIREEAGELCQTLEANEGRERAASEMADLLYHSMVLLNLQAGPPRGVEMEEVLRVLRKRFTQSGLEEKAARPPKA
ncbi:hypothetical protein GPECTOR_630g730 [Gonium pectorale]|uniref:phosphoribosyl-ATP diphosphatase n=1 Tax=Gonium pectorale TaxID=33097 RepID=A0A150FUG2_GONPE|nr:hypothetical protein GPECTOR_630g730 [Gonium pectorale]|eukprot:KXZ41232.1 hypothetical protein GPECTOR_630g730 [Gonium pectorale]